MPYNMIVREEDKEGSKHTEYYVQIAEKNSRTYTVRGVNSMAEAIAWVEENGYDTHDHTAGVACEEMDGWWQHHRAYKAKSAGVKKYSACAFKGRVFTKGRDRHGIPILGMPLQQYCNNYLKGHEGGVCPKCQGLLEQGYKLKPKEE